jgi:hypothetical protein
MNKKVVLVTVSLVVVLLVVIAVIAKTQNKNISKPTPQAVVAPAVETPKAVETPAQAEVLPPPQITEEQIKEIMKNNISGTVDAIDAKSITVKAEDGTSKTMSMEEGKTFIISQTNNEMKNVAFADVKVGMKAFANFDKETGMATTITIMQ